MNSAGLKVTVYPVHDLDAARQLYGALFGAPYADQPYYVAYRVGEEEVGLDPNSDRQGMTGPVSFWSVPDVAAAVAAVVAAGGREHQAPATWAAATSQPSSSTPTKTSSASSRTPCELTLPDLHGATHPTADRSNPSPSRPAEEYP